MPCHCKAKTGTNYEAVYASAPTGNMAGVGAPVRDMEGKKEGGGVSGFLKFSWVTWLIALAPAYGSCLIRGPNPTITRRPWQVEVRNVEKSLTKRRISIAKRKQH